MAPRNYGSIDNKEGDESAPDGLLSQLSSAGEDTGADEQQLLTEEELQKRVQSEEEKQQGNFRAWLGRFFKMACLCSAGALAVGGVLVILSVGAALLSKSGGGGDKDGGNDTVGRLGGYGSTADDAITKIRLDGSPEATLGLHGVHRADGASPSSVWGSVPGPYPTNSWYLNLVSHRAAVQPSGEESRVYTVPYIIDTAAFDLASIIHAASSTSDSDSTEAVSGSGIRVHWPYRQANANNVQMVNDFKNGLSLGTLDADVLPISSGEDDESSPPLYVVDEDHELSVLGVSLKWQQNREDSATTATTTTNKKKMTTHIVRGMPYATMRYYGGVPPTIQSYNALASPPKLDDGTKQIQCQSIGGGSDRDDNDGSGGDSSAIVEKEMHLHFMNSDFTWAVFVSRPVRVRCEVSAGDIQVAESQFHLQQVDDDDDDDQPLTVRVALLDQCTTGESNMVQHCREKAEWKDPERYIKLLRERAHIFPSSPQIDFAYPETSTETEISPSVSINIDWNAESTHSVSTNDDSRTLRRQLVDETNDDSESDSDGLIMFGLPHHYDKSNHLAATEHCIASFHGQTCLVEGSTWSLQEDLVESSSSFLASQPPQASAIPELAKALREDISYRLSSNLLRAAADTYFSGKLLARLGRVILIATELNLLANAGKGSVEKTMVQELYRDHTNMDKQEWSDIFHAASTARLPSTQQLNKAVDMLKRGVEVWLHPEKAEAPYIFDRSWGGLVNCGCDYSTSDEHGVCENEFPDCPALDDVNIDFGNGWYNDHHFHYGYHVYAAAVVAQHDHAWAIRNFERVMLYIRDFANPSATDEYFTQFRQKDWFLGSSWASGIVSAENSPHGRNQESSSEAIAAYEGVALFGASMVDAFRSSGLDETDANVKAANQIKVVGEFLTSTELRATNRYWHVWSSDTHVNTYPDLYKHPVVGMLYETMASFQTWFSPLPVVSYGIQLLPLTPIAEIRDQPEWASELYPKYKASCASAGDFCVDNGWSIIEAGLLATTGEREKALKQALAIPSKVFASEGGLGNSLTNTIWYIATRKPAAVDGDTAKDGQ